MNNDELSAATDRLQEMLTKKNDELEREQKESLMTEDILETQIGIRNALNIGRIHGDINAEIIARGSSGCIRKRIRNHRFGIR